MFEELLERGSAVGAEAAAVFGRDLRHVAAFGCRAGGWSSRACIGSGGGRCTATCATACATTTAAFAACDVPRYATFLSPDLEFYQDHTGLTNYQQNLDALRDRCAEGITLRRELDKDTLIINPAPGAGAIQYGTQRFYSKNPDGTEHLDATARFTNIRTKASGTRQLTRIISFDHH